MVNNKGEVMTEDKQDKYFECLEVCDDNEQEANCREVCTPALKGDPITVPLPEEVYPPELTQEEKHVRDIWLGTQWE